MKSLCFLVAFGLVGLLSLSTFSSCSKEHDEKNLPVEEVLPLPEEEVLPSEEGSASKPGK